MMRSWCLLVAGVALAACLGCGNQAEKNKNKDLDRPRPEKNVNG
jgi:hypothetical protein